MVKKAKKSQDPKVLVKNRQDIAKALEILFAEGYVDRHKLYFENFIRGMFFSAGGVIGATVLITIVLWLLSLFNHVPFIGPIVENAQKTIESSQPNVNGN
jgi:Domain of unknown function (DUF5665)